MVRSCFILPGFPNLEQIAFALNWSSLRDKGWDGSPAMQPCAFSALQSSRHVATDYVSATSSHLEKPSISLFPPF